MRRLSLLAAAAAVAVAASVATGAVAAQNAPERGASWLVSRQAPNGAVPDKARPDEVAEAVVALVGGAAPADAVDRAMAFVTERGRAETTRGAYVARVILAAVASKRDPRALGGVDYVARLDAEYKQGSGTYDIGMYANGLAYLAKVTVSGSLPDASRTFIAASQCGDGGFAFDPSCADADTDTTALLVRVLKLDGANPSALTRARKWLAGVQNENGGFPFSRGGVTNTNSTALVLSALAALGEKPDAAPWKRGGGTPLEAILRLQMDNGAFRYDAPGVENLSATVQAVPAVASFIAPTRVESATAAGTPVSAPPAGAAPGRTPRSDRAADVAVATTPTTSAVAEAVASGSDAASVIDAASDVPAATDVSKADESAPAAGAYAAAAAVALAAVLLGMFAMHRRRLL